MTRQHMCVLVIGITAVALESGCAMTRQVTNTGAFARMVRQPIQLHVECLLYRAPAHQYTIEPIVLITQEDKDLGVAQSWGTPLCILPVGTPLVIRKVYWHNYFEGRAYDVIGTVHCQDKDYTFEYLYGSEAGAGEIFVERAPWEDASTPHLRIISANTGETFARDSETR